MHEAALDAQSALAVDADEGAGASDLVGIEADRAIFERGERGLEFGESPIDLFGQVVVAGVGLLEPVVFGLKRSFSCRPSSDRGAVSPRRRRRP